MLSVTKIQERFCERILKLSHGVTISDIAASLPELLCVSAAARVPLDLRTAPRCCDLGGQGFTLSLQCFEVMIVLCRNGRNAVHHIPPPCACREAIEGRIVLDQRPRGAHAHRGHVVGAEPRAEDSDPGAPPAASVWNAARTGSFNGSASRAASSQGVLRAASPETPSRPPRVRR